MPEALGSVCKKVVEDFYNGLYEPEGLNSIQEWLELEGWDELVIRWESTCLNLSYLELSDEELFYNSDLVDSIEEIDNAIRVRFARNEIEKHFSGEGSEYSTAAISTYEIMGSEDKSVMLGCLLESEPGGASAAWLGLFASKDAFYDHLRSRGGLIDIDLPGLTDNMILEMWKLPQTS